MATATHATPFYGWRVVAAAFVLAAFGWGIGFFGPPVFIATIHATRGIPVGVISAAVTVHFLVGAAVGATLPFHYRRFGAPAVTRAAAAAVAAGLLGWALAAEAWQLFAAAPLTGAGWGGMSAAAINAVIAPWFERGRPAALAMAYNGGSVGGIVFSPLWVAAIGALGFPLAAAAVGAVALVVLWALAETVLSRTPRGMGQSPDGLRSGVEAVCHASPAARPLPGLALWCDRRFATLALAMALGLFAQIGLVAHLFSLLVPALGARQAGLAMGLVTALAMAGRTLTGWLMRPGADRRMVAALGYAAQLAGSLAFLAADGTDVPLLLIGAALFGVGFGNATSLPPLIAQVEFVPREVPRVVSLIVGMSQAGYAFAPAAFGLIRDLAPRAAEAAPGAAPWLYAAAALAQGLAIAAFLAGRRRG